MLPQMTKEILPSKSPDQKGILQVSQQQCCILQECRVRRRCQKQTRYLSSLYSNPRYPIKFRQTETNIRTRTLQQVVPDTKATAKMHVEQF